MLQIHREFLAKFPDNDTFLARFVSLYVLRILQYCSLNAPDLLYFVNDIKGNEIIEKIHNTFSD